MSDGPDADTAVYDHELARFSPRDQIVEGLLAWALLGVGPHCATWMAWSERLRAPVALKLPLDLPGALPHARSALEHEVRLLDRLVHPSFPRLLAVDLACGTPHLVTEFVDG